MQSRMRTPLAGVARFVLGAEVEGDRRDLEVAVAIADPALIPATAQQVRVGVEEASHIGAQRVEGRAVDRVADGGPRLLEVLRPVALDDRPGAELGDRGAALGPEVELRDNVGDGAGMVGRGATLRQHRFEHAVGGQAPHHDRVVDGVGVPGAAGAQRETVPVGPDRLDAQVDVGAQAAVALDLGGAHTGALVGGREVEEAEVDGLLDLVDAVAGEDDEADVGLHEQAGFARREARSVVDQPGDVGGQAHVITVGRGMRRVTGPDAGAGPTPLRRPRPAG